MSTVCASCTNRKALYRKAESAADRILEAFQAGDLPKPLAAVHAADDRNETTGR